MGKSASHNGLDMAREYWTQWGHPWLEARHPGLVGRVAVGLFSGSDVLGADDELSRDHGWGPRFDVFRADEDGLSNESLQEEMRAAAPTSWEGFRNRFEFAPSIGVHDAATYFGGFFPGNRLPESATDWVRCGCALSNLESHLHYVRHGSVFHDPGGLLDGIRERLRHYPEDVWLLRMALLCFDIAHYGEYNFCWRIAKRKDPVAASMAVGYFQHAAMALAIVMDRDYAPYWKWIRHVFRSREPAETLDPLLAALSTTPEYDRRAALVTSVCRMLMEALVQRGIVPEDLDDGSGLPLFFQARAHLLGRIGDPVVRALV